MKTFTAIRRLGLGLLAAATLVAVVAVPPSAQAGPDRMNLRNAWQAILDLEAEANLRDAEGAYVSQSETPEALAQRLSPYLSADYVGVNGVGHITELIGYQPTHRGPVEYAAALIGFRDLSLAADLFNGGDGAADWIHTGFRGSVSGNLGQFVLNFEVIGSLTDDEGNRLPVEVPLWMLGSEEEGSVAMSGRCVCVCERAAGQWRISAFYFVLSPTDMLFE